MARRDNPEINAGSMADIAFLLLIFFLVTTTMDVDQGISRKLPEKQDPNVEPPNIKEKNIFDVLVNRNNEILVQNEYVEIGDIRQMAKDFIDNGGGVDAEGNPCDWCNGAKDPESSDHPKKAVVSIESNRGTSYSTFISVQNELVAAYNELRDEYAKKKFGVLFNELSADRQKKIKDDIYPQIISERPPVKN